MMHAIAVLAVFMSVLWMAVTGRVSLGSAAVGYALGVSVLLALRWLGVRLDRPVRLSQIGALGVYIGQLLWNIVVSSWQVAQIILSPNPRLETGILAVPSGDMRPDQLLAALSAHGINISPGQLVIDMDDDGTLYIHCLDVAASRPTIEAEQQRRIALLRSIVEGERRG